MDEPVQKACIYRIPQTTHISKVSRAEDVSLAKARQGSSSRPAETEPETINKFTQIRVKSIQFMEQKATAIYFYDMTHHIESLKLESEVLE